MIFVQIKNNQLGLQRKVLSWFKSNQSPLFSIQHEEPFIEIEAKPSDFVHLSFDDWRLFRAFLVSHIWEIDLGNSFTVDLKSNPLAYIHQHFSLRNRRSLLSKPSQNPPYLNDRPDAMQFLCSSLNLDQLWWRRQFYWKLKKIWIEIKKEGKFTVLLVSVYTHLKGWPSIERFRVEIRSSVFNNIII